MRKGENLPLSRGFPTGSIPPGAWGAILLNIDEVVRCELKSEGIMIKWSDEIDSGWGVYTLNRLILVGSSDV
jgi:hypothetical protein